MSIPAAKATVYEDSGASLLARITGHDGANVTQATFTSITYGVYIKSTDDAVGSEGQTVTVADVIFDTLQTNATLWPFGDAGYNFKHDLPAASFPTADTTYIVEYVFTPVTGAVWHETFEIKAAKLRTS
jgi:hypothetical protein